MKKPSYITYTQMGSGVETDEVERVVYLNYMQLRFKSYGNMYTGTAPWLGYAFSVDFLVLRTQLLVKSARRDGWAVIYRCHVLNKDILVIMR